jgi:GNAT superfamily N-acetyltransferase
MKLVFQPATAERWAAVEKLFGPRGASGGCRCMWWRLPRSEFEQMKGEGNRLAFQRVVAERVAPGILAHDNDQPVGWCAVAPRSDYPGLERSRVLKRVDDEPVWSITCFFIAQAYRRKGVSVQLLKAAVAHARKNGARIVEGYPVEPRSAEMPAAFAWTGTSSAFRQAGFNEVARRSETRPIMRLVVQ